MTTMGIRWFMLAALAAAVGLAGCSSSDNGTSGDASEQQSGRLHLELVTRAGQTFRLRDALFEIRNQSGEVVQTLDSEVDPDAESLTAELSQGSYSVALLDGWSLEQLADDGSATPVNAALVSPNPRSVQIRHEVVTDVVFTFATSAGTVTLGQGSVSIGIDTTPTGALGSCDLLTQTGCDPGQTCLLADEAGATFCAQPGALQPGEACSSEQCVAGSQCLRLDDATEGVCTRFCDPGSTFCGCQALSFDENVGICQAGGGPGATFEAQFPAFQAPAAGVCDQWNTFRAGLAGGSFGRVTLSGSLSSQVYECDDPASATQICNALAVEQFLTVNCNGRLWTTGSCGGAELSVDSNFCSCGFARTVRPCIGNEFWGGVDTETCGGPTQTISVTCE